MVFLAARYVIPLGRPFQEVGTLQGLRNLFLEFHFNDFCTNCAPYAIFSLGFPIYLLKTK